MNYLQIIIANLFGIYILNEEYNYLDILGSAMIFSSAFFSCMKT